MARVDIKRDIKKNLLISGDVKRDLYCKRLSEFKFIIQNRPSLLLQTFCFFYLPEQGIPVKLPLNPITEFCILPTMFQNTMLPKITVGFPLQGISVVRAPDPGSPRRLPVHHKASLFQILILIIDFFLDYQQTSVTLRCINNKTGVGQVGSQQIRGEAVLNDVPAKVCFE